MEKASEQVDDPALLRKLLLEADKYVFAAGDKSLAKRIANYFSTHKETL